MTALALSGIRALAVAPPGGAVVVAPRLTFALSSPFEFATTNPRLSCEPDRTLKLEALALATAFTSWLATIVRPLDLAASNVSAVITHWPLEHDTARPSGSVNLYGLLLTYQ